MENQQVIRRERIGTWIETKTFFIASKNWFVEMWLLMILELRIRMAIKLADMKHKVSRTSKRYWVLPDVRTGGLLVIDNAEIVTQKKKGTINKESRYLELRQKAFYVTSTKNRDEELGITISDAERKEMRKRYITWQKTLRPIFNRAKVGIPVKGRKK